MLTQLVLLTYVFFVYSDDGCTDLVFKLPSIECHNLQQHLCRNDLELTTEVLENASGEINITVEGGFCFKHKYTYVVKLLLNEEELCDVNLKRENFVVHSEYEVFVKEEKVGGIKNCLEVFRFNYVFSGCYILTLEESKQSSWFSNPFYIETSYNKSKTIKRSDLMISYTETKRTLEVSVEIDKFFLTSNPKANALLSKTESISRIDLYGSVQICDSVKNKTCRFTKGNVYKCIFYGLDSGNYSFMFHLTEHPQCNPQSFWQFECIWRHNFAIKHEDDVKFSISTSDGENETNDIKLWLMLFVVGIFIMFLSFGLCICFKRKFKQTRTFSETHSLIEKISEEQLCEEVLLVYFRESKELAAVVNTLKEILTTPNIRIRDIYDLDEKLIDPHSWLENKLMKKTTRTVVLLTPKSLNLQKFDHTFSNYCDDLFNYALQLLKIKPMNYTSLYVIQLEQTDCISFLNGLTRYKLPEHLNEFLRDLHPDFTIKNQQLLENFQLACTYYYDNDVG